MPGVSQPDRIVDVYNKEHRRRRIPRVFIITIDPVAKTYFPIPPGRHASAPTETLHCV
jgi:hypothetical protein